MILQRMTMLAGIATTAFLLSCATMAAPGEPVTPGTKPAIVPARPGIYAPFELNTDLSRLTARERQLLGLFIDASAIMDDLFWQQAYGDKGPLLDKLRGDAKLQQFAELNYGPWDRLDGDAPFVAGVGPKPPGSEFYPHDITKDEFETANLPQSKSEYTLLRRNAKHGLEVVPYHVAYADQVRKAAALLEQAAGLADDPGLKRYLTMRAAALRTDEYRDSDRAWLDMKNNRFDLVIGPIETYEDKLFGYKAAYEAYVLVKDMEWSQRLARYAAMLPELQRGLPVPDKYKAEKPGTDSDLNAYDVLYYAGHCNAGSKTIAINLPNDETVQLEKGTRRLQLKNAMRAKFDKIMLPIADELIVPEQRPRVTFDAFFANTMFHEVAHGLGIKNTVAGTGTVRAALKEQAGWIEEEKADVLGLYMVTKLQEKGEITGSLDDYYVTFLTGIVRSVRWGATEAHSQANMVTFNFLADRGAFAREPSGQYRVDVPQMRRAMDQLSAQILQLQGDGDYTGVQKTLTELGVIRPQLGSDVARLGNRNIPVDVAFRQGRDVLGLR
jgi:Peptidase family M49.